MRYLIAIVFIFSFYSCEKDITIDLPKNDSKLVIEGRIESGSAPFVILSNSVSFFDEINFETLEKSIVTDAKVFVNDGTKKIELSVICSNDSALLPLLPIISQETGIPLSLLQNIKYCVFTDPTFSMIGDKGKNYELTVEHKGKVYTSTTQIPVPVPLDTVKFKEDKERPGYGFLNVVMSEPAGLGNCYRWFSKRLTKDTRFLSYLGSSFEDKFIDGKTFNYDVFRPQEVNSTKPEDLGDARFRYLPNDTVVVKFCSIDKNVFEFFRSFETEAGNNGNPFAAPNTIKTNIKGGAIGVWAGYGAWERTYYLGE